MENDNQKEKKKAAEKAGGLLFVGSLLMGMAGGFYFDDIKVGLFAGMGLGFMLMAITIMSAANKNK